MSEYTTELASLLKKTGITKKKVAEIAGVVPSTVSRWMSGESAVPRLVLEKLRQVDAILNEK
jgi:transcriptional regulator with XRE-family HTH domain